jgi:hypothetical protein
VQKVLRNIQPDVNTFWITPIEQGQNHLWLEPHAAGPNLVVLCHRADNSPVQRGVCRLGRCRGRQDGAVREMHFLHQVRCRLMLIAKNKTDICRRLRLPPQCAQRGLHRALHVREAGKARWNKLKG